MNKIKYLVAKILVLSLFAMFVFNDNVLWASAMHTNDSNYVILDAGENGRLYFGDTKASKKAFSAGEKVSVYYGR